MKEQGIEAKTNEAFAAALRKFDAAYPQTRRVTAETFAYERFVKACAGKVDDPRFASEAPAYAYRLLLEEHRDFNKYARATEV